MQEFVVQIHLFWPRKYQVSLCLFVEIRTSFRKQSQNIMQLFQQRQLLIVFPERLAECWSSKTPERQHNRFPSDEPVSETWCWHLIFFSFDRNVRGRWMACVWLLSCIVCLQLSFPRHLKWKQIWRPDSHLRPPDWELWHPLHSLTFREKKYALAEAWGTIHPLIGNLVITGLSAASLCELPICGFVINFVLRKKKKKSNYHPGMKVIHMQEVFIRPSMGHNGDLCRYNIKGP